MPNDKSVKTKSILMVWPWPIVFGFLLPLISEHPSSSLPILQVLHSVFFKKALITEAETLIISSPNFLSNAFILNLIL